MSRHSPARLESAISSDYITGVTKRDKKLVVLVNLAKALSVEDKMALAKAAQQSQAAA